MSHHYRCSKCRGRNVFRRALTEYVRQKRCKHCGHGSFYVDRERVTRKSCSCSGYHHAHRRGSRMCEHNPMHLVHRAKREGLDDMDVAWLGLGQQLAGACPF